MSATSSTAEGQPDEILNIVVPPNAETEEDCIFEDSCILFRYSREIIEWVGRGIGIVKILKSKKTGTYRILMRQNQTYRVCLNHQIPYLGNLLPKKDCSREFIWTAYDFADGHEVRELFAIRFGLPEIAYNFKTAFEQAKEENKKIHDSKAK
ncbi:RanBP1 domain containing protein [Trichomonas vaginalis G3]|uniref:RanBP1 domain containing protein n=1 Tax=Trichomonas vaginalis (strain ATCC PRA-98 / G3) TaxID=412133 RepID=A2DZ33_TRIV3|nr:Ran GTPase binding [Trichomonas vaginalis G3]EAY14309.1 RanBP1 domain containing protein [Trichomonas vaginalis G3]KAI5517336.1 Ran GTPase binding [Trichomonas vaginalis G3]|eukprot:XP_001326532.1 RanBP1 domain containing protein [Trichomonas vaginalis G3]